MTDDDVMPEANSTRHHVPNETRFAPGDIVVDGAADPDDRNPAVVMEHRRDSDGDLVPAWAAPIPAMDGKTVAEANPEYDMNDAVAIVAFADTLDRTIGGRWIPWADTGGPEFMQAIRDFADEWGIPLKTYDYPESRLKSHPDGLEAVL